MKVTSYVCDSCGGGIPLKDLSSITVCPYCDKNFYINKDWENELRITTENAERIMVDEIRNIKIPEVKELVSKRDALAFKKVNESLILLQQMRASKKESLDANNEKINRIEAAVGHDYEDLMRKKPKRLTFRHAIDALIAAYVIIGCIFGILTAIALFMEGGTSIIVAIPGALLMAVAWPLAFLISEETRMIMGLVFLAFIVIFLLLVFYKFYKEKSFMRRLDGMKKDVDLKRVEMRKELLRENAQFDAELQLLDSALKEVNKLAASASILKATEQFSNLSPTNIIKKINFALQRMERAPIEFEVACTNFNSSQATIDLPFKASNYRDDIKGGIRRAIEHVA